MDTRESEAADRVRQVPVPPEARRLSTLSHIDYADAFIVEIGSASDRTPEQWARVALDQAPISVRTKLLSGWSTIGLKLDIGGSAQSVLGWQIRRSTPEFVLLGADSRIGMPGELLFQLQQRALLFATFVEQRNALARAVWAAVKPVHVPVVRQVLEQASIR
jgi:hypothetical protein